MWGVFFTMARYKSQEAQANNNAYIEEYKKQHYDQINVLLPKGSKKVIQEYAKANGKSVSKLILDLLEENLIL